VKGEKAIMRQMAIIFSLMQVLSTVCAFGQDQAPAPVFKDGDFWQFRMATKNIASSTRHLEDGIYELAYSQAQVKISVIKDGQKNQLK
jgi:hypothetical protein